MCRAMNGSALEKFDAFQAQKELDRRPPIANRCLRSIGDRKSRPLIPVCSFVCSSRSRETLERYTRPSTCHSLWAHVFPDWPPCVHKRRNADLSTVGRSSSFLAGVNESHGHTASSSRSWRDPKCLRASFLHFLGAELCDADS